ncbi:hypothetical protein [Acinetobacter sp. MD2(2019)]|uniref:hypothetical protein n=1 Tax=Acinetobacter sp. MD2(2019) TaxID=2605273 RepID=UPI002D1EC5BE|nr:hypothetical protein [Acinetobacter sp. MD2(2019)]MEB3753978.1 hypothetical protein [Acinetobacter sp. MD2(2019)]
MKYFFKTIAILLILGNTASSSNKLDSSDGEVKATQSNKESQNLSIEDQVIIKKYKDIIQNLNFRDKEHSNKVMKDNLSEIRKIKNDYEREKIEMQIYW